MGSWFVQTECLNGGCHEGQGCTKAVASRARAAGGAFAFTQNDANAVAHQRGIAAEGRERAFHPSLTLGGAGRGDYHFSQAEPWQSRRRHSPAHPGMRAHRVSPVHCRMADAVAPRVNSTTVYV